MQAAGLGTAREDTGPEVWSGWCSATHTIEDVR